MFGNYYLYPEAERPWTAPYQGGSRRNCLADNSTLHVPYAGSLHELYVGNGSVVTVGEERIQEGDRLCLENRGEYVIENELVVSGSAKKDGYAGYYGGTSASDVFKIEKATCNKTDGYTFYFAESSVASHGTYYFGAGGINFGSGKGYFGIGKNTDGDAQTIRPWYGDFTIGTTSGNDKAGYDIYMNRDITFNTDDESGVGRTITVDARFKFQNTPTFTVTGSGKVLVNSASTANAAQPPVTVTDAATLAFAPGASLTTSNITVNAGATLEVAESAAQDGEVSVALGCGLTLADGAALAFNFTKKNVAPVLDVSSVAAAGAIKIKVSADGSIQRPTSGEYVLTSSAGFAGKSVELDGSCPKWARDVKVDESGNIVLTVSHGLSLIIR